jgi:hypothetical protein
MDAFTISRSDIERCPKKSLKVRHYRADGTCYCNERAKAKRLRAQARKTSRQARDLEDRIGD